MAVRLGLLAMLEAKPGKEAIADELLAAPPFIRTIDMVAAKALISG